MNLVLVFFTKKLSDIRGFYAKLFCHSLKKSFLFPCLPYIPYTRMNPPVRDVR